MHYASRSFTISVLRLHDRQDWRDTPHIAIYVVLYPEIHIIYFRTRTLAYYSMSDALILLTYETENSIFFYYVMVAITLVLHTVWGDGVSATLGCWLLVASVSDPAKKHFGGVGLALGNVTWPPPAVENHPTSFRTSTYHDYTSQPSSHLSV